MSFFDFFRQPDINRGVTDYRNTPGAILLDVRTPQEYREGYIPGSRNIPLQSISRAESVIKDKHTPLFVYCYSGSRSAQAVRALQRMGYANVKNLGGIAAYTGKVAR